MTIPQHLIEQGRTVFFEHGIDAAIKSVAATVWDEAAREVWQESGEGWNGEYPGDQGPDTLNPYRASETA